MNTSAAGHFSRYARVCSTVVSLGAACAVTLLVVAPATAVVSSAAKGVVAAPTSGVSLDVPNGGGFGWDGGR